jgi:GH15 family glucan-1,4-alpha-glucosidase
VSATPIADYALLSDRHTAALVSSGGSVDWLCLPRFDSPSVFTRLLDSDAGHFGVRPTDPAAEVGRRYLDGTMVLETMFTTATGTLVLRDALATGPSDDPHQLGAAAPRMLVRCLTCTAGEVDVGVEFMPRPEYGVVAPLMSPVDGGVVARGGADILLLCCSIPLEVADAEATGRFTMREGEQLSFGLLHRTTAEAPPEFVAPAALDEVLQTTVDAWRSWSQIHQGYEGPWQELVHHSGRVLQALTYQPTWAVVAAPTTSLPEEVGGVRNWDYRYSWVRDASLTLEALWVAACPDEAEEFFNYLAVSSAGQLRGGEPLQIMFGIGGEHDLSERELGHLGGWRDSRPVRVGNGAWNQRQIDVYGELLGAAYRLVEQLDPDYPYAATEREFLVGCADAAAQRWREPDAGIWEVRGEPQHFLYSKLMCWVALERAIAMADLLRAGDKIDGWQRAADEIRDQILTRGFSDTANAFTQAFGSDVLDASALMIPLVGFLPADDPRVLATVDLIAERLTDSRGLIYRYLTDADENADGLPGHEGTFLLCTFWLAQALAAAGQIARAREVFERAISYRNDVGLLSEEVDPETGELLGNFPQAFSHIGLVNAAWAIAQAGVAD